MTSPAVRALTKPVYCRCVSSMVREAFGRLRREHEMDMARHQAIRPDLDGSFTAALCKEVAIERVVGGIEETIWRRLPR